MRTFFDSSAFAKRYVAEKGSWQVNEHCMRSFELSLNVICMPEIVSALNRQKREKRLSRKDYDTIKRHLFNDVRDAVIVNLTTEVVTTSLSLLESFPLRAMDAIHIARQWLDRGIVLFVRYTPTRYRQKSWTEDEAGVTWLSRHPSDEETWRGLSPLCKENQRGM